MKSHFQQKLNAYRKKFDSLHRWYFWYQDQQAGCGLRFGGTVAVICNSKINARDEEEEESLATCRCRPSF
jgi:hypothetical protein